MAEILFLIGVAWLALVVLAALFIRAAKRGDERIERARHAAIERELERREHRHLRVI